MVLLVEVLRVIVQGSRSPIASQKASGKDYNNPITLVNQLNSLSDLSTIHVSQWLNFL
uniref:Uncharacterized protein n=1 Tax=Arundo donax TaxID=35708 RepID=A0A0A9HI00_ARUDO